LPYQLDGWSDFEQFIGTLVSAKAISTIREVWWDIRPHPNFGTVELRICDGLPTMSEVSTVAAIAQCLVEWLNSLFDRGYTLPTHRSWVVRENKWRAARHGIDAEIIVSEEGRLLPLRDAITDLVEELLPMARKLGCTEELAHAQEMAARPSYMRQRAMVEAGASLPDVVANLVTELRTDRPWQPT
jgi:carboxylate-amine ligase